jgi:hypothetical protein
LSLCPFPLSHCIVSDLLLLFIPLLSIVCLCYDSIPYYIIIYNSFFNKDFWTGAINGEGNANFLGTHGLSPGFCRNLGEQTIALSELLFFCLSFCTYLYPDNLFAPSYLYVLNSFNSNHMLLSTKVGVLHIFNTMGIINGTGSAYPFV